MQESNALAAVTPDSPPAIGTATYSPDDNKLRIYPFARLDADVYARVRAAGFIWAPKQDLFVAPMWTPDRADLCLTLCGEIDDEDRSLVDRAEERADRFDAYHAKRRQDATHAHAAATQIMDGIPLGQPILIGHHSERHARKDAERIEHGIRRAIRLWETAEYWQRRAAGAIRHAQYKERPDVRARRIKTIDADRRKVVKHRDAARAHVAVWSTPLETPMKDGSISPRRRVIAIAHMDRGYWGSQVTHASGYVGPMTLWEAAGGNVNGADPETGAIATPEAIRDKAIATHAAYLDVAARWIAHYDLRLEYERALLAEAGGLITDRTEYPIVPGGRVRVGGEWVTVVRVHRTDGRIVSVTTNARYVRVKGIEEVRDYQPPTPEAIEAVQAATKLPPIINADGPGAIHLTKAEFDQRRKHSDCWGYRKVAATAEYGAYRHPYGYRGGALVSVFLSDQPVKPRPQRDATIEPPTLPTPERVIAARVGAVPREPSPAEQLRETLRAGVQVVTTSGLFCTPIAVGRRMVALAELRYGGQRILEPSAGSGALLSAVGEWLIAAPIIAIEINAALVEYLRRGYRYADVRHADFLTCTDLGTFDRIVMNPPFDRGGDIGHIEHARQMLAPGGRLVAICADGPRQQAKYRDGDDPEVEAYIPLAEGTFKDQGTHVRTAIVVLARSSAAASARQLLQEGRY